MLHVKERELVVPGQLIAEGSYRIGDGTFREGKFIYSSVVGLAHIRDQEVRVIPLRGRYIPRRGDTVIGVVVDSHYSGWILDLNSPYMGNLFISDLVQKKVDLRREDLNKYLKVSDAVLAEVKDVDERMRVQLEAWKQGMGKIEGGKLVEITPMKIPRVVGRGGSMLSTLESVSGCKLRVGQNGRIMIWGENQRMVNAVVEALFTIEREAHTTGLTDRIRRMLENVKSGEG